MCRHLAYLGPATSLAGLLLDPPHSLLRQTWAPVDMRAGGSINADGFGIGWYDEADAAPVRYRRGCPMWTDATLPDLARSIRSGAVLAAARNGTVGMPVVETACAPFTEDHWLFSHNGMVAGWPHSVEKLAANLPTVDLMTLDAPTDAALLWALVRQRLRDGAALGAALATVTADVVAAAPGSRVNLLATDGTTVAATTCVHSLSVLRTEDAVLVSSEPTDLDDPRWQSVPDGRLLTATPNDVQLSPI